MCPCTPLIVFLPLHPTLYALRFTLYTFYSSLITHSLYLILRILLLVPYIYTPCQRPRWRSATERTPSIAPEESPLWGIDAIHRMAQSIMGTPRTSWVSGESGGTCRPNVDEVNNHCDYVAEREVTQPNGYRVVPYRVGTTAYSTLFDLFCQKCAFY